MNTYVKKYKMYLFPFLCTLISGITTHCSILWMETIAPDALATGLYKVSGGWEMSLGRWAIQLLDNIRGGVVNEVIILLFSLIFLSIASCVICSIFKIKSKFQMFIIAFLIGTAPQFSETLMFTYCADSYTLAFLLSSLAAFFIINKNDKKFFLPLAIVCVIFSLALYQAYISITTTLILIYSMKLLFDKSSKFKDIILFLIKSLTIVLLSMILYLIITKLVLYFNNIEFSNYKGASDMSISTILQNLHLSIPRTYKDIIRFLFGENIIYNHYWNRNIINILLCLANAFCLVYLVIKNKIFSFSKICLLLCLLIIMPISINLMDIIMPNTQTNIITGPALLLIYVYIIVILSIINYKREFKPIKIFKNCIYIALICLCYTYMMSNNATYMSRNDVYKNYYTTANDILSIVHNLDGYKSDMKWCFTDNIKYQSEFRKMSNGTISNDYETWDNFEGIWHSWAFYHRYLGINLYMVDRQEYFDIVNSEEVQKMPIYPSDGSIQIINNIVVIKLSDFHY